MRVFQHPDTPLSGRGEQEALRVAARLVGAGIGLVLTSDFARARATAERIAAASGASLEVEPLLRERDFGALRGRPYAELGLDPFAPGYTPPGGESVAAFHSRVAQAFALIVERRRALSGALVVVTHGLVCHAIVANHSDAGALPDHFDNTGLTELAPEPPFTARRINCTQHLVGGAAPGAY